MEQEKRGRGRPKIDVGITALDAPSRRQALNAMYMYEGVRLISAAAAEIPDSHILWCADEASRTATGKNGILEQLGRMAVQDKYGQADCIYITNLAVNALKAGRTSREVEKAIRNIRMANRRASNDPDSEWLHRMAIEAANELWDMGCADG